MYEIEAAKDSRNGEIKGVYAIRGNPLFYY